MAIDRGRLVGPAHRARAPGPGRAVLAAVRGLVALLLGVAAGFGWMYALRGMGILAFGPGVRDALPLLQLASASTQPLARVAVAWISVGAIVGAAVAHTPRPIRVLLVLMASLLLLDLASEAAFAVAHTENLGHIIVTRRPGLGVPIEALLFTLGSALSPVSVR